MNKIIALIFGVIIFSSFASAFYEAHGIALNASSGANSADWGMKVNITTNVTLTIITKNTSQMETARVLDDGGTTLAAAAFVNNNATFNINLTKGLVYYFVANSSSGVHAQSTGFSSYPVTGTFLNWISGYAGGDDPNGAEDIIAVTVTNNTAGPPAQPLAISINLTHPLNGSIKNFNNVTFNASISPLAGNSTNATLYLQNSSFSLINITTNILSGNNTNRTFWEILNLPIGTFYWNVYACATNATTYNCTWANSNFTFYTSPRVNTNTYNATTYETVFEGFSSNVTLPSGSTISSIQFYFNGTNYSATSTSIGGNDYRLSSAIDIPLLTTSSGAKNWWWNIIFGNGFQSNLTANTLTVGAANITYCGVSASNIYYNITYKNETTALENVNGTISSTWSYYIGQGSVNKSYTYINATTAHEWDFCFNPLNRTVNTQATIQYDNAESLTRTFTLSLTTLTNVTTLKTLYLLPTSIGIYTRYKVINVAGNTISGVSATVSRTINGVSSVIESGLTDSSGQIAFFLNPSLTYDYVFTKAGVGTNSFSLIPNSLDTYTITLGSTLPISNGSTIGSGLLFNLLPTNTTLINGTTYAFGINVSGNTAVNSVTFNLTNASGYQVLFLSGGGSGLYTGNIDTGLNTSFIGYYNIRTATENISGSQIWIIGDYYEGDYSLFRQLSLFNDYGFANWIKILIALSVTMLIMVSVTTSKDGGFIGDIDESSIVVGMLCIWLFSLVGWLDTGIVINSTNARIVQLAESSSQYGIAIITSALGISIIGRRLFT